MAESRVIGKLLLEPFTFRPSPGGPSSKSLFQPAPARCLGGVLRSATGRRKDCINIDTSTQQTQS